MRLRKKKEKLLHIFDLDDVISLGGKPSEKKLDYETRLYDWMQDLVDKGCILIVVSHNLRPLDVLRGLSRDFISLFAEVYSPVMINMDQYYRMNREILKTPNIYRYWEGNYYIQSPKELTIKNILKTYNIKASQAIFYDDFDFNVNAVKKIKGITTVLVDSLVGIDIS